MKKVLIIDDDPDILEAVELILSTFGYDTSVTTRGEETLTKIEEYEPDLIILDVLLSGMDGRHICKGIRKKYPAQELPIIMMSAHPHIRASVKDCGADGFIAKPFSLTVFTDEVKKHVGE